MIMPHHVIATVAAERRGALLAEAELHRRGSQGRMSRRSVAVLVRRVRPARLVRVKARAVDMPSVRTLQTWWASSRSR